MGKLIKRKQTPEMKIFENSQFGKITVLEKDGEPWFIAKEIADILEYSNTNKMTKRLDVDEKAHAPLRAYSNEIRSLSIINESGLYEAIFGSRKPEAKEFKRWVKTEVLPAIRKTGSYSLDVPKTYSEALRELADTLEDKEFLEQKVKEDRPLVTFANQVQESMDSIDMETFAKVVYDEHIRIGRNRLFKWLRKNNYLMDSNLPYQSMIDRGYFSVKETTYNTSFGRRISKRTMITPMGQIYFCNKLKEEF
jgi:anti-repressor protein